MKMMRQKYGSRPTVTSRKTKEVLALTARKKTTKHETDA